MITGKENKVQRAQLKAEFQLHCDKEDRPPNFVMFRPTVGEDHSRFSRCYVVAVLKAIQQRSANKQIIVLHIPEIVERCLFQHPFRAKVKHNMHSVELTSVLFLSWAQSIGPIERREIHDQQEFVATQVAQVRSVVIVLTCHDSLMLLQLVSFLRVGTARSLIDH